MSTALFRVRGNGLAAWAVAALLVDSLPDTARVVVTDADAAVAPSSLDVVALPADALLLRLTGLSLDDIAARTGADVYLGTVLERWRGDRAVIHAPQEPLPAFGGIQVHDLALRAAIAAGHRDDYAGFHAPFRFQARAVEHDRYAPPSPDRASPRSLLRPGLMLGGALLTDLLRRRALAGGAQVVGKDDTQALLTIDTRAAARPAGGIDRADGSGHDRTLTLHLRGTLPPRTSLRVTQRDDGLLTLLGARDGAIATFDHFAGSDADAIVAAALPGMEVVARDTAPLRPGFAPAPWQDDCLLLGPAAVQLGAVMALDAALLNRQLALLADLLPARAEQRAACAAAYNARFTEDAGHHADLLHLILMHRSGAPALPAIRPELRRRLDQFLGRNRAPDLDGDPFDKQMWLDTMIALGLVPDRYDPQADRVAQARGDAHLGRMAMAFDATLAAMPRYRR